MAEGGMTGGVRREAGGEQGGMGSAEWETGKPGSGRREGMSDG